MRTDTMRRTTGMSKHVSQPGKSAPRGEFGFTMIEVMIVVAIIAILAAIAIPMYQRQIRESRRTSAKTALFDLASREETYYSTNNAYTATLANLNYGSATGNALLVPNSSPGYYSVSVPTVGTAPASFIATAVPQNDQIKDSCGTYQLTNLGTQTTTGTTTSGSCW